jgi:hypothetical protein
METEILRSTTQLNTKEHFDELQRLAQGSAVTFVKANRRYKGIFRGTIQYRNQRTAKIQVENERVV